MLSTKKGNPIAIIKYHENENNKIIYINEDSEHEENEINYDNIEEQLRNYKGNTRINKQINIQKLKHYLKSNSEPFEEELKENYKYNKKIIEDNSKYEIKLSDGSHIEMIPPLKGSMRYVIAGMTGSGKSTKVREYVEKYHKLHPNNKIFLFSQHQSDPIYDKINYFIRIKIDDEIIEDPITIDELKNSLCVFDDVDNIQQNNISKAMIKLINDINCNGRHHDISCITTLHILMNYQKTKSLLSDISGALLFLTGSKYAINRYLKFYGGLDATQIKKITSLKSRWFYISLTVPQYILSEYEAFIIK
jgi:molybdopterin converting factor small subunit